MPVRSRSLTVDVFLAALAVLSAGCTAKKESAPPVSAEPPAGEGAPAAVSPAPPPAASAAPAPTIADDDGPPAVDAGVERKTPRAPSNQRAPHAACGAQGCSPDMKKGK